MPGARRGHHDRGHPAEGPDRGGKAREKEELALEKMELTGSEQLTPDDYVLPYIDDDDSEAETTRCPRAWRCAAALGSAR